VIPYYHTKSKFTDDLDSESGKKFLKESIEAVREEIQKNKLKFQKLKY
jgi:hypothetical protein